jgi:CubicO group peptidase (beta-lactamase class C family)
MKIQRSIKIKHHLIVPLIFIVLLLVTACVQTEGLDNGKIKAEVQQPATDVALTPTLTEQVFDATKLEELSRMLQNGEFKNVHSVLVLKDGEVILEEHASGQASDKMHYLASVTKSITSLLIGIAMDQGYLDGVSEGGLENTLVELLPGYASLIEADPLKENLRLRHVLSMSAGFEWDETTYPYDSSGNDWRRAQDSDDPIQYLLQKPIVSEPGTVFNYNGALSIILSELIEKFTGMPIDQFAEQALFEPLGIEDTMWDHIRTGLVDTTGGLHLGPGDMAKIGTLVLNGGVWEGNQIVSKAWIDESTRLQIDVENGPEYGFQWWRGYFYIDGVPVESVVASGHGGQKIYVFPSMDTVVVVTQQVFNNNDAELVNTAMVTKYILPAFLGKDAASDSKAISASELERYVGEYYSEVKDDTINFKQEDGVLFSQTIEGERIDFEYIGEDMFLAVVNEVIDVRLEFMRSDSGDIEAMVLHVLMDDSTYKKVK